MNKPILALLVAGSLVMSLPAWSASSFNDVQQRAKSGDAKAQLELGYRYFQGNETVKDLDQALRWFQRAAQQGYTPAEYVMGLAMQMVKVLLRIMHRRRSGIRKRQ